MPLSLDYGSACVQLLLKVNVECCAAERLKVKVERGAISSDEIAPDLPNTKEYSETSRFANSHSHAGTIGTQKLRTLNHRFASYGSTRSC